MQNINQLPAINHATGEEEEEEEEEQQQFPRIRKLVANDDARWSEELLPPRASQNFQEFKGCCKQHHAGNQGVILCQCWPLGHGPAHTLTHRHTHGHMATHTHRHTHTHTHARTHAVD